MRKLFLIMIGVLIISITKAQSDQSSAINGEWFTAAKDAKILVYEEAGKYYGKIVWANRNLGKDEKNPDHSKRNNELIGSIMLSDFVFGGNAQWKNGKIYDPTSGKIYSCTMKLRDEFTLEIRGYIGISLFGRTEVWTKNEKL